MLLLVLLLVAAALKTAYVVRHDAREPLVDAPYGDSVVWLDEVARFRSGEAHAFYKPPLYTVALVALGMPADADAGAPGWRAARDRVVVLQVLLGLALLALVFAWARELGGDVAGVVAFLVLLAYGPATFHETKLLDTVPGLVAGVGACYLLWRTWRADAPVASWFTAGVVFGVAAITRPANLLYAPALLPFVGGLRRPARGAALLVGAALAVAPVTWHNARAGAGFLPVNYSEGYTFLVGNNPNARGMFALPPGYPDGVLQEREVEAAMARAALGREPTPAEQRDHSFAQGWRFLEEHPERVPGLLLDKLRFAVSPVEVDDNYSFERERTRFGLLRWAPLPFTLLLGAGLASLVLWRAPGRRFLAVPLAVSGGTLLLAYVTGRYRLPLAPWLAIATGVGVAALVGARGRTRAGTPRGEGRGDARRPGRGRLLAAGLAFAAPWAFTLTAGLPHDREAFARSRATFDVVLDLHAAETAAARGDPSRAAEILEACDAAHPGALDLPALLARLGARPRPDAGR